LGLDVQGQTARDVVTGRRATALGGRAIVAVVEPADVRRHDDPPDRRRHDRARDRRVLLQGQVRSRLHVVRGYRELDTAANGHAFNHLRCWTEPLLGAVVHQELQGRRLKPHLQSNRVQPHSGEARRGVSVGGPRRLRLCRDAIVAVMKAADFWNRNNATG